MDETPVKFTMEIYQKVAHSFPQLLEAVEVKMKKQRKLQNHPTAINEKNHLYIVAES